MVCNLPTLVCRYLILYFQHPTTVKNRLHFHTFSAKSLHNPNKCLTFAAPEPPSLLTMLNRRQTESNVKLVWTLPRCEGGRTLLKLKSGVVLFFTIMRLSFDKSFMQPDDMVELLRHRGLEIENPQRVSHYIRNIGYHIMDNRCHPNPQCLLPSCPCVE